MAFIITRADILDVVFVRLQATFIEDHLGKRLTSEPSIDVTIVCTIPEEGLVLTVSISIMGRVKNLPIRV